MLFNSITFLIFITLFFCFYWLVLKKKEHQNILIFIASYVFYGWWDWRFLALIFLSTVLDFYIGKKIFRSENRKKRKQLLALSIFFNIGMLMFFKYFNFFIDSWVTLFNFFGLKSNVSSLNIILPVGISFYTFQTLSYTIDVYNKKLKPTDNFLIFASFVSFFPQLVAGPIERAKNLLPQFTKTRVFDYNDAVSGMRLVLWGFFKKIVIADNCALVVNEIFNSPESQSPLGLLTGVFCFSFQIYGDFSGYSDIAIGLARIFGFDLMTNFKQPYFSKNIAEFWQRWHISLTTWFKDYLYIPLGGSKKTKAITVRNVFIIFLVSGFWHGANWTFIAWGFFNSMLIIPIILFKKNNEKLIKKEGSKIKDSISVVITFFMIMILWVFFRANNISDSFIYLGNLFKFNTIDSFIGGYSVSKLVIFLISIFVILDWNARNNEVPKIYQQRYRYLFYFITIVTILNFSVNQDAGAFIYFQF